MMNFGKDGGGGSFSSSSSSSQPQQQGDHPYKVSKIEIKDPEYMSQVPEYMQNKEIPGFPSTTVLIGRPGSGKTNVLMFLITKLWLGFFDRIYLLGPTIESDKAYKNLRLDDSQKVSKEKEIIPKLVEWSEKQIEDVKQDPEAADKALFVFEDFTSFRNTIQTNPAFLKAFNAIRHHKASSIVMVHKITSLERTARMCCQNILVWPVNRTEVKQVFQDYGPNDYTLDDFELLMKDAWTPDEENPKPFLYINKFAPEELQFRKCFTRIIQLEQFKGKGKLARKMVKDRAEGKNTLPHLHGAKLYQGGNQGGKEQQQQQKNTSMGPPPPRPPSSRAAAPHPYKVEKVKSRRRKRGGDRGLNSPLNSTYYGSSY